MSYDPDYETYFGRLGRKQHHPEFRTRKSAIRYDMREVRTLEGMGRPARIWGPLPRHTDSGHIHVAVLTTHSQFRKLFPSEGLIRDFGSLTRPA